MAGIDVTGSGPGISLTKDIFVNNSLIGPFDASSDVEVFLQNGSGTPIVPTSSVLVGNDLTITANIPAPSGVLFKFPIPSQYISYRTGDTGWRFQNGWYNITQPDYPAKKAELDITAGANMWYTLKTALTVNGVSNKSRYVDINGIQTFSIAGNANQVVIDKLTGIMFTRNIGGNKSWNTAIDDALSYSISLNSVNYSDWYLIGLTECLGIFGNFTTNNTLTDPATGIVLITFPTANGEKHTADTQASSTGNDYFFYATTLGSYYQVNVKGATGNQQTIYIHDARNLIS